MNIKQELSIARPYFVVEIANCSARYSPCDHAALSGTEAMIYNDKGTLPAFKTAMGAEIYTTNVQVVRFGPCKRKNTPPIVVNPPGGVTVQGCSDFNYTLSTTFYSKNIIHKMIPNITALNRYELRYKNKSLPG